ncbi:MAG: site-2 protease family protein [Thermoplasmatota archaeon]
MVNGWLITLGLVNVYIILLFWLVRTGRMEKYNLSLMLGFILMIRTQRGRGTLEKISKPAKFWHGFADTGVAVAYAGMILMTALMVWTVGRVLQPDSGVPALGASEILIIPGVNPFVPLWYGLIALIITLVVHESGHGIVALANKMRLKSLGLLMAVVPVGAFVEPDEDDLTKAPRRARLRVYAAGPMMNFVFATITIIGFAVMMGAMTPMDGTAVASVVGTPASDAGILPGDLILTADNMDVSEWDDFIAFMDTTSPGQNVTFGLQDRDVQATLGSRWDVLSDEQKQRVIAEDAAFAEELQNDAFLGVAPFFQDRTQDVLAHPVGEFQNFLFYVSLPIGEIQNAPYLSFYLPTFYETPFSEDIFWPLANVLFWTFWINIMVGLTNILPMLPLDGGHLFRDGLSGVLERFRLEEQQRAKIVNGTATVLSFAILAAVVLQIIGPRLV